MTLLAALHIPDFLKPNANPCDFGFTEAYCSHKIGPLEDKAQQQKIKDLIPDHIPPSPTLESFMAKTPTVLVRDLGYKNGPVNNASSYKRRGDSFYAQSDKFHVAGFNLYPELMIIPSFYTLGTSLLRDCDGVVWADVYRKGSDVKRVDFGVNQTGIQHDQFSVTGDVLKQIAAKMGKGRQAVEFVVVIID